MAGPQIARPPVGATLDFDTSKDATLRAKVAISFVSVDGAVKNLAADAPAWDFAGTQAATKARWASYLGRIAIGGGQTDQLKTFYAALYHSLQYPVTFNDVDGGYAGFDGKVHNTGGRTQYANFSGWDIYRSEIPLLATLAPDETSDMMQSLVNDADQYGWLPKWPVYNDESGVMNGDSVAPIIAGAYAFGARDFDAGKALAQLVKGATKDGAVGWGYQERPNVVAYQQLGYVPSADNENVSMTEEYAIDDFAIGQFAAAIGDDDTAATFATRGQNWQHVFDPSTGYVRPHASDGAYPAGPVLVPPPPGQFAPTGFAEGNAAQYTWMVPQNLAGLIGAVGGRDAAIKRLDDLFTKLNVGPVEPYYWAGNEPMFSVPWTYDYLGQPWKTQDVVRRVQSELFAPTPDGEPGNDDLGAQSAWYVWSALGLYPVTPGTTDLAVNTPLFPHVEIRTGAEVYLRKMLIPQLAIESRLSYTFEVVDIKNVDPSASAIIQSLSGNTKVSKVSLQLLRDTRDKIVNTTYGNRIEVNTELADVKVAMLVGAEGPGLTEHAMRASDVRVRIPMSRGTDSLNVATAAALAFYERVRVGGAGGPPACGGERSDLGRLTK